MSKLDELCYPFLLAYMQNKVRQQKLVFTGILLLLLFTYPIITIANRLSMLGGFPVLFLYIFLVWIVAAGAVTREAGRDRRATAHRGRRLRR